MEVLNPALVAINGYQKYISPYKGFSCAHRVATGEVSCSEFVKQAISKNGFFSSVQIILDRFTECKKSAIYLNENRAKKDEKKDSKSNKSCTAGDVIACLPTSCGDVGIGSAGRGVSGACEACSCSPF